MFSNRHFFFKVLVICSISISFFLGYFFRENAVGGGPEFYELSWPIIQSFKKDFLFTDKKIYNLKGRAEKIKKLLINGKFIGKVEADVVEISNGGVLEGDIIIKDLIIEQGGVFEGSSKLKQKVKNETTNRNK